jgi:hypothetical protein
MPPRPPRPDRLPDAAHDYLARRLDGARDLYLLALALGERGNGQGRKQFGPLIQEARIHFVSVIEEARIAGFEIQEIQNILSAHTQELGDSIRPDLRAQVDELFRSHTNPR